MPETIGRVFVCGDIHGCLDKLEAKLAEVSFDRERDHLYALGDLVDRGPKSLEVLALLDEPWFDSILGNHEVLMIEAYKGNAEMHVINGGAWFAMATREERGEAIARVKDLPIALTVTTPTGRKIGLVHADMVGTDWDEFTASVGNQHIQDYALWARERAGAVKRGSDLAPIRNIDHVYFGHTPMKQPMHAANMSWIDTGCFGTGNLTLEQLS